MDGDRGIPNEVNYTFSSGDFQYFRVDAFTGEVRVGQLMDREHPDILEKAGVMDMQVLVSEKSGEKI